MAIIYRLIYRILPYAIHLLMLISVFGKKGFYVKKKRKASKKAASQTWVLRRHNKLASKTQLLTFVLFYRRSIMNMNLNVEKISIVAGLNKGTVTLCCPLEWNELNVTTLHGISTSVYCVDTYKIQKFQWKFHASIETSFFHSIHSIPVEWMERMFQCDHSRGNSTSMEEFWIFSIQSIPLQWIQCDCDFSYRCQYNRIPPVLLLFWNINY